MKKFNDEDFLLQSETARRLSSAELVNREEDLGLEGLRQAKLSYKPCRLVEKWDALPADSEEDFPGASPTAAEAPEAESRREEEDAKGAAAR